MGSESCAVREEMVQQNPSVISIVDDDQHVRAAIKSLIRSLGYAAISFQSADDFLNSGRIEEVSCLVTDIQMPGKSGLDLLRQLRAFGYQTPVIFVTALPERFRDECSKAGAAAFLGKPFRDEALEECLVVALGGVQPAPT
jgi:FixJ family two-component response regulator